jgi:hypothetical protein
MAVVSKPKCLICGKPVEDIDPLDVPFHVECWVEKIHGKKNGGSKGTGIKKKGAKNTDEK